MQVCCTHNDELCEALLVLGRTAAICRVFEVQVEAVELTLTKEFDTGPHELGPAGRVTQHRRHFGDAEVPPADRQQRLHGGLTQFDLVERRVPVAVQCYGRSFSPSPTFTLPLIMPPPPYGGGIER